MRQGLDAYRTTGAEVWRPHYLALLAEGYGKAGQAEEGLGTLTEALAVVEKNEERYYEAELYRLKGELTLQKGVEHRARSWEQKSENLNPNSQILDPHSEAEACFHKAIEIACKQQAKSLELRATMSLACLWQLQGKRSEAHRMLSAVYNWFTEGFDTRDLQEAKALLDGLEGKKVKKRSEKPKREKG
jgi:predicted ATPase